MDEALYNKTLSSLQARCVRTEYCRSDMMRKALTAFDGDSSAARRAVDELVADGFVDDARYAAAFARDKASLTGWGPAKISSALRMKSIPSGIIAEALTTIDETAAGAKMEKLLSAKWKSLQGDPYARFKLLKYALTRGYEYDQASLFIQSLSESSQ